MRQSFQLSTTVIHIMTVNRMLFLDDWPKQRTGTSHGPTICAKWSLIMNYPFKRDREEWSTPQA
ncbi:hypothetical protein BDV34DRAFT_201156 [Aspergillus parasiticus]|uniref:Uncharacterized protein n=1 Tax=Aspergillus parasiticus TaxID=5067 RepID=A0A5N6DBL2_ASPPA|nr:hypothetical protein BDV34DRAFT_201156 [Aspergillus parasiticus]